MVARGPRRLNKMLVPDVLDIPRTASLLRPKNKQTCMIRWEVGLSHGSSFEIMVLHILRDMLIRFRRENQALMIRETE